VKFEFNIRRLSNKRVRNVEPAGRGLYGLCQYFGLSSGRKLVAGKELHA
jgi:hypothetical protein